MNRTPDFSRLITTLRGGQADCVPLIELGVHPVMKERILGRPCLTPADEAAFMARMGYDYIKIQPVIKLDTKRKTASSDSAADRAMVIPDRAWSPESTGIITNWQEFESYPWPAINEIDYSRLEAARRSVPDGMGIVGQYGDIFTTVWEMMGFETFAIAAYMEPDLVAALFRRVGDLILSMFDTMAEMDWVGALWYSDDIAYTNGLMLSPDFFREHLFPLLARIGERARMRGIPFIYHSDGLLWDVMDDIRACGVTALHPIEPKAMEIRELKQRLGGILGLCGGIDLDLLARAQPDEIRALVRSLLRDVAPGGGWCAGSSNSITEYVKYENYMAMVETIVNEGNY